MVSSLLAIVLFVSLILHDSIGYCSGSGLVVSMCLGGALIGCLFSGLISDGIGRRKAFQLSALPMIIGASLR